MEFKKVLIILTITIVVIIGAMFGVSYGWYAYSNAESNISGTTIKEKPTVIFSQTEYIAVNQITPIYDEDRYTYANKNSFTVTVGENLKDYEVAINISLTNIAMSNELKIANFKYELLQDGKTISSGSFSELNDKSTTLSLLQPTLLTQEIYPKTYNYELYIWLSDDNTNQNNLMSKVFSAKVNVDSAAKKINK